jgi:uncharacterized protein (TIGR03790 family)
VGVVVVAGALDAPAAQALTAEQVAVVVNGRSALSVRIGAYYADARGIPPERVVRLDTVPREEIDRDTFLREVEEPIAAHLRRHGLVDRLAALVLAKDVPLKIRGTGGMRGTQAAVDSELTLLPRVLATGHVRVEGRLPNPYYRPAEPGPFEPLLYPIYLVTRLDGYTWEDVRGLIDRGLAPARDGAVVLDLKDAWVGTSSSVGDRWLRQAAERLRDAGLQVRLDETTAAVTGERDVLGYAGWGSNDPAITWRAPGFTWRPGALAAWFVSTSARTFVAPPPGWTLGRWPDAATHHAGSPQSMIADLIAEGVTGAAGYVYEPYLDACARPDVFLPAYRAGYTLAESFYMALPHLSWQAVVIGDPLAAPWGQTSKP